MIAWSLANGNRATGEQGIPLIDQRSWIMRDDRSPAVAHVTSVARYEDVVKGRVEEVHASIVLTAGRRELSDEPTADPSTGVHILCWKRPFEKHKQPLNLFGCR